MKLGIIGTSEISHLFVEGALQAGFTLNAVCSRNAEKGAAFFAKYGGGAVFTELDEMAASPNIDVVYIATPPALHFEQTMTALKAGKHVLVEKPCYQTLAQARHIIEFAASKNLFVLETLRLFYSPLTAQLREALPLIGPVRYASFNYMRYSSKYDDYKNGIVHPSFSGPLGGGALSDLCVYCVYAALVLFGKPNKVIYSGVPLVSGADSISTIVLKYHGFNCVINGSKQSTARLPSEIQGEKASLIIENPFMRSSVFFQNESEKKELCRQDFNDMVTQQKALHAILSERNTQKLHYAHQFMLDSTEILEECRIQART
jgi:predicted dehydrogenase